MSDALGRAFSATFQGNTSPLSPCTTRGTSPFVFKYDYVDDNINKFLLCVMCGEPAVDPQYHACGRIACGTCKTDAHKFFFIANQWFVKATDVNPDYKQLDNLKVNCVHGKCESTMRRIDYFLHIQQQCQFMVCKECKEEIKIVSKTKHEKEECSQRREECKKCNKFDRACIIAAHVNCDFDDCKKCKTRFKKDPAVPHENICIERDYECKTCLKRGPFREISLHESDVSLCPPLALLYHRLNHQGFNEFFKMKIQEANKPFQAMIQEAVKNAMEELQSNMNTGEIKEDSDMERVHADPYVFNGDEGKGNRESDFEDINMEDENNENDAPIIPIIDSTKLAENNKNVAHYILVVLNTLYEKWCDNDQEHEIIGWKKEKVQRYIYDRLDKPAQEKWDKLKGNKWALQRSWSIAIQKTEYKVGQGTHVTEFRS